MELIIGKLYLALYNGEQVVVKYDESFIIGEGQTYFEYGYFIPILCNTKHRRIILIRQEDIIREL